MSRARRNTAADDNLNDPVIAERLRQAEQRARARADAIVRAARSPHLTVEQLDGVACVVCGRALDTLTAPASKPVGVRSGGQVFACVVCYYNPNIHEEHSE
jgi:hypothetical protein